MKIQWNQWLMIAAALTVGVGMITSVARAQDDGGTQDNWMSGRARGFIIRRIERQLEITDAQKEQIKTILKTEKPTITSLAARVEKENQKLQSQPTLDEAQVRQFAQQHEATLEDVLVERQKVRSEILAVLTPEQRQKAQQMRVQMRTRFNNRLDALGDLL
jgi:Spy/CpxP family protein refolding chaperone